MKQLALFWCSTPDGDEDYFVVAPTRNLAIAYFSSQHGFELQAIKAELLMPVPEADRFRLCQPKDVRYGTDLPCSPPVETLAHWGYQYNETFHVFHRAGRIFRPEGVVRAHMRATVHKNAQQRRALRKTS